ncbi:myocardin isoform X13 [Syngnathoides biaculeatus]|uniref:myocardin isoform X13 n=1 Tax=Syngnathoides biaculeatus TaxID=300417 RepID=UPI002ADD81ED|nr:myocardin isoform X13 [Syngnathoides biaculeatus]
MTLLGSEHSILIRSKFRSVLQLRLQQRRKREQLADQGIMPHSASVGSSLEDQARLKRGRLAEELNEKLALRPGPMELVQKNIIPLDSALTMTVNHGKFPKQEDSYAFEEESSSESLSPEQHHSDESQGSACPSSAEAVGGMPSTSSSPTLSTTQQEVITRDSYDQSQDEGLSGVSNNHATPPIPVPAIVKSKTSDKNRHKKPKDVKPKVKKLKYHQYIPPDQKADKSPPPMDSAYARLLQQQQLFLQLQILSQQKHAHAHSQSQQHTHSAQMQGQAQQRQPAFSYQPHQQALMQKGSSEQLSACPSNNGESTTSSPIKTTYPNQNGLSPVKPGPLPANLDDLKVSELRQHLRIRGLPVSGTKTALIERLRPFKDSNSGSSPSGSSDITTVTFPVTPTGSLSSYQSPSSSSTLSQGGYYPYPSNSCTPPISPASSENSLNGSLPDSFSDVPMSSPPQFALQASPGQLGVDDGLGGGGSRAGEGGRIEGMDAEKDKMLVEKQKVIEELTWKLHQEQRQQLTRSQQMDELLDVLIESGEMPANAREERERSSVTKVLPHITVFPGYPSLLVPRLHRHYEHQSPTQLHYDHLETLLGPMTRGGEATSLEMATDDGQQQDDGNRGSEGYGSSHNHQRNHHHPQQDKVGTNRDLPGTPLSPLNKVSAFPEVQGMVSMAFSETPWETMEWLDLTPTTSTAAFNVPTSIVPSIFNAEFLDVTDMNLNSAMDLHLEHW